MYETGKRVAEILIRTLKGETTPTMLWRSLPVLTHMLRQTPITQPMKGIMNIAITAENSGRVLCASGFGGFPLSDIRHVGLSVVVVSNDDITGAGLLLDQLLQTAWERRSDFVFPIENPRQSISRAKTLNGGPIILVDHGDNCGSGGSQDVMEVISEVIRQDLKDVVAGTICDQASVAEMISSGIGKKIILDLGGKTDMPALGLRGKPLRILGRIKTITDGTFTVTGPMMTGMKVRMGRNVVLETKTIDFVISERRFEPFDVGCFKPCGIEPAFKRYVVIKSRQHFRASFAPIGEHIVLVAGPGVCSSDYDLFPFKNLRRPIYPLD